MGLAASVWGKDLEAVERIAKQIEAGGEYRQAFAPMVAYVLHQLSA
jgi:acyl-CoA reductase-like NAD-dependent aldehyde dehydrogenase